ncbi:MAG: hypothetical protein KGH64_01005 [Candidatus Micrarchaeota archaeon]|nr:hypothetical protein [Candidatus Micrarchaeota archaeon]MDE1833895.1 hypothetical protein [Candidatus Micrarchaeota archaeon]MDE1860005.1 hypothetical protein [Candidatus Micrarchaeota archaeon]
MSPTRKASQQKETVVAAVLISEKRVLSHDREKAVPGGSRIATLKEVALAYRYDSEFRKDLKNLGFVWIGDEGLSTQGIHIITDEGEFTRASEKKRLELSEEKEKLSLHWPGQYQVTVDIDPFAERGLVVSAANELASHAARVAYVKEVSVEFVEKVVELNRAKRQ